MRQILGQTGRVLVARMPRPAVEPGSVLVRVHYSLVSVGTEIAAIAPPVEPDASSVEKSRAYLGLAWTYLGKAINNPEKAAHKLREIASARLAAFAASRPQPIDETQTAQAVDLLWNSEAAQDFRNAGQALYFVSDQSPGLYQVGSAPVAVSKGYSISIDLKGRISGGPISLGVLNQGRQAWVGSLVLTEGEIDDRITFEVGDTPEITLVFSNANTGKTVTVDMDAVSVELIPPSADRMPSTELHQQGWNLGYSVAGEVIAIGEGVTEYKPGDLVACGGAGQANHADYVSVKKNLVVRIPPGCSLQAAASVSIGAIALQGVRRASPRLGDVTCVIGLGLIGLLTVQMLKSNGCRVIGFDLDAGRVDRARQLGLDIGTTSPDDLPRILRDLTHGQGADQTIITAATKSNAPLNLAMTVTRSKGTVVIVGDIGLEAERAAFYRKEIDLLMSTSYGPGRYDKGYEDDGRDYPYAYVRWTQNRNMQCYLDLIASGQVDMESLIDMVVPIDEAPAAYKELATKGSEKPIGVLLHYPERKNNPAEEFDSPSMTLRGHGRTPQNAINYALVGAGGFGTSTLVPTMDKVKAPYFLRAVVSRDATRGGNFARQRRVEIVASEMQAVLTQTDIDLLVVATRHHEHADQVIAALKAGKNVFVEKPLAVTWEQLDAVVSTRHTLEGETVPLVMVGFNRRFSPALQTLKKALSNRTGPLVVTYRLNGGYIPLDHWIQTAHGAGRNIGEACHMYDCFRFLTGSRVKSITASSIEPGQRPYLRNDNFVATLTYEDGSVCNLVYTALGPKKGLPKEYIEVFCDGDAYIVDDYKKLSRASDSKILWEGDTDKGHAEELQRLGVALTEGSDAPIPFEEIVETTAVSLYIEDVVQGRVAAAWSALDA